MTKVLYEEGLTNGKTVILDYGSRGFRIRVFDVEVTGSGTKAAVLYSKFDRNLSLKDIEYDVSEAVTEYYCEETGSRKEDLSDEIMSQLKQLSRSHKDLFFQRNKQEKPAQLYYNFAYPPFRKAVTHEISEQLIDRHRQRLNLFLDNIIKYDDISHVVCVGSGFEMPWARETVNERFKGSNIICPKSPKNVQASGAALICAINLNVCEAKGVEIVDSFKAGEDFGVLIKGGRFLPLIEKGTHISAETRRQSVILEESTESPIYIDVYSQSEDELKLIENILVQGLPIRPKRTTKLSVRLSFSSQAALEVTFTDEGFGEISPKTDYTCSASIML